MIKLLEENIALKFFGIDLSNGFLDRKPNTNNKSKNK